nr:PREDICTED: uncharacterized protein LOC109031939 isoform X1 [Bemisia tabaci]
MCPSKLLVSFAFVFIVALAHFATAKPSVSSDVVLDEEPVETVDNQKIPEPIVGGLYGAPMDVNEIFFGNLGKCAKRGEFCDENRKCCRRLKCTPFYRSPSICWR